MGAYTSVQVEDYDKRILTNPRNPDWILAHQKATSMALVEVERSWSRFRQQGAGDDGVLRGTVLQSKMATSDKFVGCILSSMLGPDYSLTFLSYLRILQWTEKATDEDKVRDIFGLLCDWGEHTISKDQMFKILRATYPKDSDETIMKTTETFLSELDKDNQGSIGESQFVEVAEKLSSEKLKCLQYRIIPIDVITDSQKMFDMTEKVENDPYRKLPSTDLLKNISGNITSGDIDTLAYNLGISTNELQNIQRDHPHDISSQVEELMKRWRDRNGSKAYSGNLKVALQNSGMKRAADIIDI